jgi:hypothetical protein
MPVGGAHDPQTFVEQEYMQVKYYERIFFATLKGLFVWAWEILILSMEMGWPK